MKRLPGTAADSLLRHLDRCPRCTPNKLPCPERVRLVKETLEERHRRSTA